MANLIERINGVNYIQLEQYVRICKELRDVKDDHERLLDAIHNDDLNTANSEMSNKVCGTCRYYKSHVCEDNRCEVLDDACNALREENDELKSQNHDYEVMVGTLLYVLGVRG